MRSATWKAVAVWAIMMFSVFEGTVGLTVMGLGATEGARGPLGDVPPWTDPLDDLSHVYVPPGGLVGVEVVAGEARLKAGQDTGWIASTAIGCPPGHGYDLVVLEADTPGESHVNVSILDATAAPTDLAFANATVPGFVNLTGLDVSVFRVDASKYPSIRIQVNLAASGTDRPRLLSWKLMYIEMGIWQDDFLGTGKLSSWRGLNISGGEVRVGKEGATYDPYPTIALPHADADVDVFFASSSGTGYDDRDTISGTKGTNGMDIDDLNGDGYLDLILAADTSSTTAASAILWGSSSGKWSTSSRQVLNTIDSGSDAATGDFDGDGDKDVIITCLGGMIQGSSFIFLNKGDGTFNAAPDITMRQIQGNSVDAGDINEDGYDDVIIVNSIQTVAKCYYSGASGPDLTEDIIFLTEITSHKPVGDVLIEDINGDGHLDVLFATENDNLKAPIYLGSDSGMDNRADIELAVSLPPMDVAVGDVNGDGELDLVYSTVDFNGANDEIVVFPGSSSGWDDTKAHTITTSSGLDPVAVVDIDIDGCGDIIAGTSSKLEVFLGGATLPTTADFTKTGLGDPGDIVVAVSSSGPARPQGFLVSEPITLPAGMRWDVLYFESEVPPGTMVDVSILDTNMDIIDPYKHMEARDVDLSGLSPKTYPTIHLRVDITGATDGTTPVLDRLLVNWIDRYAWREQFYGKAKFGSALGLDVADLALSRDVTMTDVPDLLFASLRGDAGYLTHSQAFVDAGGDHTARTPIDIATQGASAVATYDVDGDGWLDLFFASYGTSDASYVSQSPVFLCNPAGWYQHPFHTFPTTGARDVAVADLNKDGYADVVFAQERDWLDTLHNSTLFWGSASGWNATPDLSFATSGASGVEAVDVDGDGRKDVVFACYQDRDFATDSLVFLQDAGGFCATVPSHKLPTVGARAVASGDINGDGRVDLVFANSFSGLSFDVDSYIYWGKAGGGFEAVPKELPTLGAMGVAVADLDGDSDLDVVFANDRNATSGYITGSYVYINKGSGTFSSTADHVLPTEGACAVAVADLDGAGLKDLVFACRNNDTTYSVGSVGFISGSSSWPASPNLVLPTVGAMDVAAVALGDADAGGYMGQAITPPAADDIGGLHTLRYVATKGAQVHGIIAIVDALTGEVLAQAQMADGANVWDLRGALSLRAHPSVRVLVSVEGLAGDAFTIDDVWLNWTRRLPQAPIVVDAMLSAPIVHRASSVELWVNVTDEYDLPSELEVRVQHLLEGETVWRTTMIGIASFVKGAWRIPIGPDRATPVGNYTLRVNVTDSDGQFSDHFPVPGILEVLPNLPTEPVSLMAVGGDKNVTLSWRRPADEGDLPVASYRIWRGLPGGMSPLVTVDASVLKYIDTGLENGKTLYYSVQAYNTIGFGPLTEMVFATPESVPSIPVDLTAVPGNRYIDLTWGAPSDDGGWLIQGYKIYQGTDPDDMTMIETATDTSFRVGSLTNGVTYYFRVSAFNELGEGPWSVAVSTTPRGPPGVPRGLEVLVGVGSLDLSWQPPELDGGSPITGYIIYHAEISDPPMGTVYAQLAQVGADVTLFHVGDLVAGRHYGFCVAAINMAGEGERCAPVVGTPVDLPGAPQGLTATAGDGKVTLNWTAPLSDGASPVTGYVVLRGASVSTLAEVARLGVFYSYVDNAVENGRTYHYAVRAVNDVGDGAFSDTVEAMPFKPAVRPGKVLTLSGSAKDNAVTLVWSAPADDGGSPVTGYVVMRGETPDAMVVVATLGPVLTHKDGNLTRGKTYYYTVAAVNIAGQGEAFAAYEMKVPKKKDDSPGVGAVAALLAVALVALVAVGRRRRM